MKKSKYNKRDNMTDNSGHWSRRIILRTLKQKSRNINEVPELSGNTKYTSEQNNPSKYRCKKQEGHRDGNIFGSSCFRDGRCIFIDTQNKEGQNFRMKLRMCSVTSCAFSWLMK